MKRKRITLKLFKKKKKGKILKKKEIQTQGENQ